MDFEVQDYDIKITEYPLSSDVRQVPLRILSSDEVSKLILTYIEKRDFNSLNSLLKISHFRASDTFITSNLELLLRNDSEALFFLLEKSNVKITPYMCRILLDSDINTIIKQDIFSIISSQYGPKLMNDIVKDLDNNSALDVMKKLSQILKKDMRKEIIEREPRSVVEQEEHR